MPHGRSPIYFDAIRKTRGKRFGESMAICIGVDIGGTFTDFAAYDAWTGRIPSLMPDHHALIVKAGRQHAHAAVERAHDLLIHEKVVPPSKVAL
jgi:hypothetical protein